MITLRRDGERHHIRQADHEIWQTFHAPGHLDLPAVGFEPLVLLDEVRLPAGSGSVPLACDDAETILYVRQGAVAQEDSAGNSGVVHAGEFQRMTTGRGIRRRETSASQTDETHCFRITLRAPEADLERAHENVRFTSAQRRNVLCVIASPDGRRGSLRLHQKTLIHSALLDVGRHLVFELSPGRGVWIHIVEGEAELGDLVLARGDGLGVMDERSVSLTAREETEIRLLDLGEVGPRERVMGGYGSPATGRYYQAFGAFDIACWPHSVGEGVWPGDLVELPGRTRVGERPGRVRSVHML